MVDMGISPYAQQWKSWPNYNPVTCHQVNPVPWSTVESDIIITLLLSLNPLIMLFIVHVMITCYAGNDMKIELYKSLWCSGTLTCIPASVVISVSPWVVEV